MFHPREWKDFVSSKSVQLCDIAAKRRSTKTRRFVPLHARCSQEKSVVLPFSVLVAMAGKERRLLSVFTLPNLLFFPLFWVWFFGRGLSFLALDLWRNSWLSTVSLVCSSSFSESDPCSWYEATVRLVDTNENKGEIWEVKHALLLFVPIRVRVRVSLI